MSRRALLKALRKVVSDSGRDAARGSAVGAAANAAPVLADDEHRTDTRRLLNAMMDGARAGAVGGVGFGRAARYAVDAPKAAYKKSMRNMSVRANRKLTSLSAGRYPTKPYSQWTREERDKLRSGGFD